MTNDLRKAILSHIRLDRAGGLTSPSDRWPAWVVDEYNRALEAGELMTERKPLVPLAPECPNCRTNVDVEESVKGGAWWYCYLCASAFEYVGEEGEGT
jgi:hypothetical protein